jgi:probable rRNA maturation factor
MSLELTIRNRQRERTVNVRLLRQIVRALLETHLQLEVVELGVTLVDTEEMAQVNWQFLQHEGSTDVITFDHTEEQLSRRRSRDLPHKISGELFVCVAEAVAQARSFRTTWPAELVRYVVHGILHLCGHDDHRVTARRLMKREENRLVRRLEAEFAFSQLAKLSDKRRR